MPLRLDTSTHGLKISSVSHRQLKYWPVLEKPIFKSSVTVPPTVGAIFIRLLSKESAGLFCFKEDASTDGRLSQVSAANPPRAMIGNVSQLAYSQRGCLKRKHWCASAASDFKFCPALQELDKITNDYRQREISMDF